jgi:protein TonB
MQAAAPGLMARFSEWRESGEARRALAFAIVLLFHILLAVVLLTVNPEFAKMGKQVVAMELLPDLEPPAPKAAEKKAEKVVEQPERPKETIPEPIVKMKRPPSEPLFEKQLFDAVDITKLPNVKEQTTGGVPAGNGRADSPIAPGKGPGGATMYVAEWAREPTDQELAYYVKDKARNGGEALIACRTVARNMVEDCYQIDESPRGSGLARALIEASWQFRVRPPRVNNEPQVGTWVQILFTYTVKEEQGPALPR